MKDIVVFTNQFYVAWGTQNDDKLLIADSENWNEYFSDKEKWELVVRRKLYDAGYDAEICHAPDGITIIAQRNGPDRHLPLPDEETQRVASIIESVRWPWE
jgi:hypothetical protein